MPEYSRIPTPASPGTEPGSCDSDRKPMRPIIARRPLLTSASRLFAFFSGEAFLLKPRGSNRLSGSGCGQYCSLKKPLVRVRVRVRIGVYG